MTTEAIRNNLRAYLVADAAVAARFGTPARIYPTLAEKSPALPYCVYRLISDAPEYTHDVETGASQEIRRQRWQLDVFDDQPTESRTALDEIRTRLEGKKFTQGGTVFGSVFVLNEFDSFEDVVRPDGARGLYRKTLEIETTVTA